MAKLIGKNITFTYGSSVDVQGVVVNDDYNVLDVTDNGTAGNGIETVTGRSTRTMTVEGVIKLTDVAQVGKDMKLTFNSVDYPARSCNYEENWDEIDTTDGATANTMTEALAGFASRKSTVEIFMRDTAAEPTRATAQTATLLFATGVTAGGSFRPESAEINAQVRDANVVTIAGSWQGTVTETGLGLTGGTEAEATIMYKDGATDEKIVGNAIIMSKSITADVNSEIRFSYTFRFNTWTQTHYAAI